MAHRARLFPALCERGARPTSLTCKVVPGVDFRRSNRRRSCRLPDYPNRQHRRILRRDSIPRCSRARPRPGHRAVSGRPAMARRRPGSTAKPRSPVTIDDLPIEPDDNRTDLPSPIAANLGNCRNRRDSFRCALGNYRVSSDNRNHLGNFPRRTPRTLGNRSLRARFETLPTVETRPGASRSCGPRTLSSKFPRSNGHFRPVNGFLDLAQDFLIISFVFVSS